LEEIRKSHITPVFTKDNETLISHTDFIEAVEEVAGRFYEGERITAPQVRLSHPIKGRIPEAKDKPANQLLDSEKTLYYERMIFVIEIPSINIDLQGFCFFGKLSKNTKNRCIEHNISITFFLDQHLHNVMQQHKLFGVKRSVFFCLRDSLTTNFNHQ